MEKMQEMKIQTVAARVSPELKEEIVATAKELGITVSDLLLKAYRYWKENEGEKRNIEEKREKVSSVTQLELLDFINKLEKKNPSLPTARRFYEKLVEEARGNEELIEIIKLEFFSRFGISPLIAKSTGLTVYSDVIEVDMKQYMPRALEDIPLEQMSERVDVVLANFPIRYYKDLAEFCEDIIRRQIEDGIF